MKNRSKARIGKVQAQIDPKPATAFKQYYRRSYCISTSNLQTTYSKHKYFIEFSHFASLNKDLVQTCLLFIPSVVDYLPAKPSLDKVTKTMEFNEIYKFACKAYFLQARIQREKEMRKDIFSIDQNSFFNLNKAEKSGLTEMKDYEEKLKKLLKQSEQWVRQKLEQKTKNNFSFQSFQNEDNSEHRTYEIQTILEVQRQLIAQTVDQIMNLDEQVKKNYFPKGFFSSQEQARNYLQKLLNYIFSVQFVKISQKQQKFKRFVQVEYCDYLKTGYGTLKKGFNRNYNLQSPNSGNIMIKRYTSNKKNEILITLQDLVKLRSKQHKYNKQYFDISKKLVFELISHNKQTKNHYPLLNPLSVLFNQLSLKIHLNYDNILYEALGLLARPKNIEQRIVFQPTPETFDPFAAPIQLNSQNQTKMIHFLYGSDKYANNIQPQALNQNSSSADKQRLMKQSETWRCLMTISFLMNQKQFYDEKNYGNPYIKKNYERFIGDVDFKLSSDPKYYRQILGESFQAQVRKQRVGQMPAFSKEDGISFYQSLFQSDDNVYQIITNYKFWNVHKRINLFYLFFKQLLQIIDDMVQFAKTPNSIKYLIRFYFNLYMNLSYMQQICKFYNQKEFGKGILLQRQQKLKLNLVKAEDRNTNYIQQSKAKFKEYQTKNKIVNIQHLIRNFNEEYKQIDNMYHLHENMMVNLTELDLQKSNKKSGQIQEFYSAKVEKLSETVEIKLPIIKKFCKNILGKEFIRHLKSKENDQKKRCENSVPLANQKTKLSQIQLPPKSRQQLQIKTKILRLQIISYILLLKQQDFQTHFFTIESIFAPIVLTLQKQKQGEIKKNASADSYQKVKQTFDNMQYLSEYLSEIKPTK